MAQTKIATIVGSIRKDSINLRLAKAIEKLAGNEFKFNYVRIDDLPLYTQEFDSSYPANCTRVKKEIESADALLFVTPEYNRSMPGVLKNAIDIASRPWGTNSFAGKPAAVCGTSPGAAGTAMAQQHLRNVLAYLDAPTMGAPEMFIQFKDDLFGADGTINNAKTEEFLKGFLAKYAAWVKKNMK